MPFAQKVRYALDYARFRSRRVRRRAEAASAERRARAQNRPLADGRYRRGGAGRARCCSGSSDRCRAARRSIVARGAGAGRHHPHVIDLLAIVGHRAAESGARTRHSRGRGDHELGPSLEQGAAPRCARHDAGLERGPEARSGGDARPVPERVVVTGAQCYDQWFNRRPSRTRDEFCRDMGLDPHGRSCCMSVPR